MFIFLVTLVDLWYGHLKLFLVFYLLTLIVLGVKLWMSSKYKAPWWSSQVDQLPNFSIVLPVFNESMHSFVMCIDSIRKAAPKAQLIVIENGSVDKYAEVARDYGAEHLSISTASKRRAIAAGVELVNTEVTILLDSDTIAKPDTIHKLLRAFLDPNVGGVVPRQEIVRMGNNFIHRMCDWYEDLRFGNTTPGLSYMGQVPCLIGRLYAVRTSILRRHMHEFVDQWLFGTRMETGDDRVITNYVLQDGYKAVYDSSALVYTQAPDTLKKFAKQRLRWSRSSFRETVLALPWLWRYPYALFVMVSDIVLRWMFFAVLVAWIFFTGTHFLDFKLWEYVAYGLLGFFVSGWIKQIPHLMRVPGDFWYVPAFMLFNTFVLTPIEWYGNLTFSKQGWLTRK